MILVLDNRDSFTFNLVQLLGELGSAVLVARADRIDLEGVRRLSPAAILVGPGPGGPRRAGCSEAVLRELSAEIPCLGVCLGMQLLFERSEEGPGAGIGHIRGTVTRIDARRVPQIGWNTLEAPRDPLFARAPLETAYFANGYACRPDDEACAIAWCRHESDRFPAAVRRGRVLGVQFHPEKSSGAGLRFLAELVRESARLGAAA